MADKKISELATASEIKNGDNIELSQDTGSGLVSLKATILAIANKIVSGINFTSALQTTDKTITGAINEVAQGGGGGGTGGHTIIDEDGNTMTARSGLQFTGAVEVTDDNVNNKTIVEVLGGDFYNPVIYSLEEREIGVWTDGKPLYQRTVHINALPNTAYTDINYPHNILNIEKIIDWVGITKFTNGGTLKFDRGYANNSYNGGALFSALVDETNITIRVGSDRSSMSADFTIRYTKTTDTAGSGSWTPQGVPTHHYSTDEQIIGTWIDGSTLYEKTIDFGALPNTANTAKNVPHNIANIDTIVDIKGIYKTQAGTYGNLPFVHPTNLNTTTVATVNNTNISITTGQDRSSWTAIVILQYTKTS